MPQNENIGVPLKDCPAKPNCVCTVASRKAQRMNALAFTGSARETIERVAEIVQSLPRTTIEQQSECSLKATFRTAIFRFVDDVEFYADQKNQLLHFRSASRLGYSDLGTNRRRMQDIAEKLVALGVAKPQPEAP